MSELMFEVGEEREVSLWFEPNDVSYQKAEREIVDVFQHDTDTWGVVFGPIEMEVVEKHPHLNKILIGRATVLSYGCTVIDVQEFYKAMQPSDLKRLRARCLLQYRQCYPGAPDLPIHNIDQILAHEWLEFVANANHSTAEVLS